MDKDKTGKKPKWKLPKLIVLIRSGNGAERVLSMCKSGGGWTEGPEFGNNQYEIDTTPSWQNAWAYCEGCHGISMS